MGGAVSAGRDNNDLVDKLVESHYIRTDIVEKVFRAVDRADYFLASSRSSAYKDLAWKSGHFHLSAPCIYSDVMEWLKLKSGLSFLNLGSGTGYLSTMAGLILGARGINHGIELNQTVVNYAMDRLYNFILNSTAIDEFDFCHPKFVVGNCLCLSPSVQQYDRVYCGAACPKAYENYLKELIKIGGILVMPLDGKLLQIKRISENEWSTKHIQCVSFATLVTPTPEQTSQHIKMVDVTPATLQDLCRAQIRNVLRSVILDEMPHFKEAPLKSKKCKPKPKLEAYRVRRITIPIGDDESDGEELNNLHNLDREAGSREMNALIHLVLSMENEVTTAHLLYDSEEIESNVNRARLLYESDDSNAGDASGTENDTRHSNIDQSANQFAENVNLPHEDVAKGDNPTLKPIHIELNHPNPETSHTSCANQNTDLINESKSETNADAEKNKEGESKPQNTKVSKSKKSNTKDSTKNLKKREKLDSGIVDDECAAMTSGNSSSSTDITTTSEQMEVTSSEEHSGDDESNKSSDRLECGTKKPKSRRQRKRHYTDEDWLYAEENDDDSSEMDASPSTRTIRSKKMKRKTPQHFADLRRQQFSDCLKKKVNKLPLPMPLKVFVNMNREF